MRKVLAGLIVVLAPPALAGAGGVELSGFLGYSFPFYNQTFPYDSGPIDIPVPGLEVDQSGVFELDSSGGLILGGAITLYATEGFGLEVRFDNADLAVDTLTNTYSVDVQLPAPHDPVSSDLELNKGEADVKSLSPVSINLKLRSGGDALRFFASGGLSRLGNVEFALEQTVSLGVVGVNLETNELEIATVPLRAASAAESESSWGGNLGLGFEIGLGERGALIFEGRGFYFPKRTYEWELATGDPLPPVQEQLLERLLERLDPVELKPWWAQATVAIAIRF
jgi:hypothetical protein